MTKGESIEIIKNRRECVQRASVGLCEGQACEKCRFILPEEDIIKAYNKAIASLDARETEKLFIAILVTLSAIVSVSAFIYGFYVGNLFT